mmetsp:Transcript_22984/g.57097  ORF Transcript_22984/g.57097 Transcript_22984/m.57097 type:complete len:117 (-) Transcript_22984:40-390(-)
MSNEQAKLVLNESWVARRGRKNDYGARLTPFVGCARWKDTHPKKMHEVLSLGAFKVVDASLLNEWHGAGGRPPSVKQMFPAGAPCDAKRPRSVGSFCKSLKHGQKKIKLVRVDCHV